MVLLLQLTASILGGVAIVLIFIVVLVAVFGYLARRETNKHIAKLPTSVYGA
jgi:hypothetical protein